MTKLIHGLPKRLYVYEELESNGDKYLVADEEWTNTAALGEVRIVGEYDLVRVMKVKAVPNAEGIGSMGVKTGG